MKATRYFEGVRPRPDRAMIRTEWIEHVVQHPEKEVTQTDGRIRRWAAIREISPGRVAGGRRDGAQRVLRPFLHAMKVKYFQDTDTLYIEFRVGNIVETKDLDENTQLDLDPRGNICAMTIEHARERADLPQFSFEHVGTAA